LLSPLYQRLQAREAKWLTRLILKNYGPIIIPDNFVYGLYHPLLPALLKIQAELRPALKALDYHASKGSSRIQKIDVLPSLRPAIGTKIGRQPFFKARSIKHCVDMAQTRRMSVEKKYDGEYCQIHIDMSQTPQQQIKIFSKSGKDSTKDRAKVHGYVITTLI
jgi:DNA ligase-4